MPAAFPSSLRRLPVAHRAYHSRADRRPENSPAAVRAAIAAGYAIEIDVQLSRDGVAMVFHDESLGRLTAATGLLADRTAAELAAIGLTDADDGIPTLREILAIVAGQVPLLIELKDQTLVLGPTDGRLEAAVAADLAGYAGDLALMSFNPHCMITMAAMAPAIPRGLTTSSYDVDEWAPVPAGVCDRLRGIPDYQAAGASFISHQADDLSRPRVAELRAAGAAILSWTIRSPEAEAAARQVADNVTFEGYPAVIPA